MELIQTRSQILQLLKRQLSNFFLIEETDVSLLDSVLDTVLHRCEINFQANDNKYYRCEWGGGKI